MGTARVAGSDSLIEKTPHALASVPATMVVSLSSLTPKRDRVSRLQLKGRRGVGLGLAVLIPSYNLARTQLRHKLRPETKTQNV